MRHRSHEETVSLKILNEVEGKEQYRIQVLNGFAALEDWDTVVEINSAWETIRERIKFQPKTV
jgi:hypothetical protein